MADQNYVMVPVSYQEVGFAKLQGENSFYMMRNYSIILGRNSESCKVDLDLSSFGGITKRISHHHARIFYDFEHHHFALEVLGINGCKIQGVTYRPGSDPVKLNSQDLIVIQGAKIYFLLPACSIHATIITAQRSTPSLVHLQHGKNSGKGKKISPRMQGKLKQQNKKSSGGGESSISKSSAILADSNGASGEHDNSGHNNDNQQFLSKEEKDAVSSIATLISKKNVVSSIATLISDLCSPGEWVPLMKLHSELLERFGKTWCLNDVSKYLTPEEGSSTETNSRPWCKLLPLLQKYPELFAIDTITRGEVASEYVRLVSLIS